MGAAPKCGLLEPEDTTASAPEPEIGRESGNVGYKLDFGVVWDALPSLLWGCLGTLGLALGGMALAIVIGIGGVLLRASKVRPLRWGVMAFVELIRNTPFLVQIFYIFFALPLIGIKLAPTPTAVIALGINGGAYAIEII